MAVDSAGNVYIADAGNYLVDEVTPSGTLSVIAGGGTAVPSTTPGPATSFYLAAPQGVAVDSAGNVYIADQLDCAVEEVGATRTPPSGVAPAFTADTPPSTATVGTAYSYTITATGTPAPTFSVSGGSLPPGLTLDPSSGVLSGTPQTAGTYFFTVSAANGIPPNAVTSEITITVGLKSPCPVECLQATNAAYGLDGYQGTIFGAPSGMTELFRSPDNNDGFEAVALEDSNGNIIIADEGARIASPFEVATPYEQRTLVDEVKVLSGIRPSALLSDAVNFADKVAGSQVAAGHSIYVTGIDLGGVEAQAQAEALGSRVSGGATFGSPGLPGNTTAGSAPLVNYSDYGDTLGFWASDLRGPLAGLAPSAMDHYGTVITEVGNPQDEALIFMASNLHKLDVASKVPDTLDDALNDKRVQRDLLIRLITATKALKDYNAVMAATQAVLLAASTLSFHSVGQYATDLGVNLTPNGAVVPEATAAKWFDSQFNATDAANLAQTTVGVTTGDLSSPDVDITATTGSPSPQSEIYNAKGNEYVIDYDTSGDVSSIQADDDTGGSYEILNDDTGAQKWSSDTIFYSGANLSGTLQAQVYNWNAGGSELKLFTDLPPGVTSEVFNYSGPDATGKLLSRSK